MQIKRTASAHWEGTGKEGKGQLSTQSGVLDHTQYGFNSRFADGIGTNPEELIGAAHAGCFSMKLAFNLQAADAVTESIDTKATVLFENGTIGTIQLETNVKASGITKEKFDELVADAKANCPVSKLLNAEITLQAHLL
jgi:lipoyl-dependent peroxiredoxin